MYGTNDKDSSEEVLFFLLHKETCLHVACVVQQKDARQWFAELSVDMEKILEIIRVILKLYEQWKNFDERKEMATILSKMPKPKPPPNRYFVDF
ncbi:Cyclin-C [Sciurus carolinensis]|uniref:Cyclin-C n=1 Tax=Sciurus carolinensis TaxID=30640 RepID=A0AA41MH76_SCICA|nr:Cyclin-C [Sciurus carolinensis]